MEQLEQLKISIQNRVDQYKQEKSNDSIVLSSIFKTMLDVISCIESKKDTKELLDSIQNEIDNAKYYLTPFQIEQVNNFLKEIKSIIKIQSQSKTKIVFGRRKGVSTSGSTNQLFSTSTQQITTNLPSLSNPTSISIQSSTSSSNSFNSLDTIQDEKNILKKNSLMTFPQPYSIENIQNENQVIHCVEDVINIITIDHCCLIVDEKKKSIHLTNIKNSIIIFKEVNGSVLIHDCSNCLFIVNCLQIRIHNSQSCCFSLYIPNHPVIEDCHEVFFCPPCVIWKDEKKLPESENCYNTVLDFKWLKQEKSPNWSILSVHEFMHYHSELSILYQKIPSISHSVHTIN